MSKSIETIFSLINYGKDTVLNYEDFSLGLPRFNTEDLNTVISIKPKISSALYGSFEYQYNRVDLIYLDDNILEVKQESTLYQLVKQINALVPFYINLVLPEITEAIRLQGQLFEEDLIDVNISNIPSGGELLIKAKPNSYLFTGEATVKLLRTS